MPQITPVQERERARTVERARPAARLGEPAQVLDPIQIEACLEQPTPETQRNELKEEFFRRIDHANRSFGEIFGGREGWRTDRGRVYIKNGPPDEVERPSMELNMPRVEIWLYSRLNKRFIFTDRQGNGEYRLVRVE